MNRDLIKAIESMGFKYAGCVYGGVITRCSWWEKEYPTTCAHIRVTTYDNSYAVTWRYSKQMERVRKVYKRKAYVLRLVKKLLMRCEMEV